MNDARYPNISAIDNRLAELENEKRQLLPLRGALRSAHNERPAQTFTRSTRTPQHFYAHINVKYRTFQRVKM